MADKKEIEVPEGFPENVNPTAENIKAFEDQQEAERKALEEGKQPKNVERVGEGLRTIPVDENEPEASEPQKSQVRQTKSTSK